MNSNAKLQLLEGEQVIEFLKNQSSLDQYDHLFANCQYKTIFQSSAFLYSWYDAKIIEAYPVAVLEYEQDKITAALWLTINKNKRGKHKTKNAKILGAGEYDAEYQTWLVEPGNEKKFLPAAFKLLFNRFPNSKIIFRFIPYAESLKWIEADKDWQKFCVIQPYRRPLLQMSHPDYPEVYKKRHLKAKYNRLSKSGKMELIEIVDLDHFIQIYDKIMLLLDFRQGALFNKTPSLDNPNRKSLYINLFKKNLLHVTVLKLDDQITSCIIGMKDGIWMHLAGLITYSPFFGKFSPGMVHIYVLGKLLEDNGYQYFDLTPGDDEYKERMASNADEVYEFTVTQDTRFKLKRSLRKYFHEFLLERGIRPMSFNLYIQKKLYHYKFRLRNLKKNLLQLTKSTNNSHEKTDTTVALLIIERNNIEHLLNYQETSSVSRWIFLENAFARIQTGESFYSTIYEGKLIFCQWFIESEGIENTTAKYVHPDWKNEAESLIDSISKKAHNSDTTGE
jgi:hypothetical protein